METNRLFPSQISHWFCNENLIQNLQWWILNCLQFFMAVILYFFEMCSNILVLWLEKQKILRRIFKFLCCRVFLEYTAVTNDGHVKALMLPPSEMEVLINPTNNEFFHSFDDRRQPCWFWCRILRWLFEEEKDYNLWREKEHKLRRGKCWENLSRPFDSNLADVSYHMFYITEFYSKRMHKYILEHKLLNAIINSEPEANFHFYF